MNISEEYERLCKRLPEASPADWLRFIAGMMVNESNKRSEPKDASAEQIQRLVQPQNPFIDPLTLPPWSLYGTFPS